MWALVIVGARALLPYQLDYEEGNILNAAVRIADGLSPYPDPHALPNVINPYGPVLYFVEAGLVKVFGVTMIPGRMLVIGCGVIIATLVAMILCRDTGSAAIGVAFGALFLCSPFVQFWWPLLRVDLVGLALTLAGMVVFQSNYPTQAKGRLEWGTQDHAEDDTLNQIQERSNYPTQAKGRLEWGTQGHTKGNRKYTTLVAAVLFVLAIYTKHTLVAAPVACVVWAWINQQKRSAVWLMGTCAALGGAAFVIGEIATHGVLAFALFRSHPDPYLWSAYPNALEQVVETHALLVALAAVLAIGNVWRKQVSLPLLYLVAATLTTLTIGKAGSNSNHLLELTAALCLAAGTGWNYLAQFKGVRQLVPIALALLIAGQTIDRSRALEFEPRNSACEQVIEIIRHANGQMILSENTGAVTLAGKIPLVSNPFVYTQLVKYGGWKDDNLVNVIAQRNVPLVFIDASRRQLWSRPFMQSLFSNYQLDGKYNCHYCGLAFVPRSARNTWSTGNSEGNSR